MKVSLALLEQPKEGQLLDYESLRPGTRERVEELVRIKQYSIDEALEDIAIEAIAMGGLTACVRPKAELIDINRKPKGGHLNRVTTEPK